LRKKDKLFSLAKIGGKNSPLFGRFRRKEAGLSPAMRVKYSYGKLVLRRFFMKKGKEPLLAAGAALVLLLGIAGSLIPRGCPEEPSQARAVRLAAVQKTPESADGEEAANTEETANEEEETPGEVQEKTPPEDALSAVDILGSTQIIAHGMGAIGDLTTTNCLEAFLAQYAAGTRVFEVDLRLTRDGEVVLRHDWWHSDWQSGISWANIPTREKFVSEPVLGQYTPLSFRDLLLLMEEYPDVCIITDTKFTESDVFFIQFDAMMRDARELGLTYLFDRIVIQIYNTNMLSALNNIYYYPHYIYTLYAEGFSSTDDAFREKAAFCANWGIEGITMWDIWWKPSFAAIAEEYGIKVYVHTVNDLDKARSFLEEGVSGIYTDNLTPDDLVRKKAQGDISVKL